MPKWGLTEQQRETRPWGIDPEWLEPAKTITDSVHKDIYVTKLEAAILDSPPMQRLRGVRQLGNAHLVYPSATHSRFSHALGTMRAAQDLMDAVLASLSGPRAKDVPTLLDEWQNTNLDLTALTGHPDLTLPADLPSFTEFDQRIAEATVLARLGGLLHDLCHVPMGHTVEDDLGILDPHDENAQRFETLWAQFPVEIRDVLDLGLTAQLRPLILSKEKGADQQPLGAPKESKYPFVVDIVGNTICADLMDYLRRDHLHCGLPFAVGSRFVDNFYVTPTNEKLRPQRMAIQVTRAGHLRHDVLTELGKYLRYRYELSERVLYHHAKVAADAMIGKLLDMWHDSLWVAEAIKRFPSLGLDQLAGDIAGAVAAVERGAGEDATATLKSLEDAVAATMEDTFLSWGDDGLLNWIGREAARRAELRMPGESRNEGVAQLADMVRTRQLFKTVGRADSSADRADAGEVHARYRKAHARRTLEEAAATFAGIERGWNVVVWVPSPSMRPKVAEVLVNRNGRVAPLAEVDGINRDVEATVKLHSRLWGVGVYLHPSITAPSQQLAVSVWVKDAMGLHFLDRDGRPVPTVADFITDLIAEQLNIHGEDKQQLSALASTSAKGGDHNSVIGLIQTIDRVRLGAEVGPTNEFDPHWLASVKKWR